MLGGVPAEDLPETPLAQKTIGVQVEVLRYLNPRGQLAFVYAVHASKLRKIYKLAASSKNISKICN